MLSQKKVIRKPAETYKACPACKSKALLCLEVDALCGECDWMSCEEYVEMGGMDKLFRAFKEHFPQQGEEPCDAVLQVPSVPGNPSEPSLDERRLIQVGA